MQSGFSLVFKKDYLRVINSDGPPQEFDPEFLQRHANLKVLDVEGFFFDQMSLRELCNLLPHLTDLRIDSSHKLCLPQEHEIGHILGAKTSLRHLSLTSFKPHQIEPMTREPYAPWDELFEKLTQLRSLDISYVIPINEGELFAAIKTLTQLQTLYIDASMHARAQQNLPNIEVRRGTPPFTFE